MKPKTTLRHFLALTGSSVLAISSASAQATSNTWDTNADGNWTDVLNWAGDAAYAEGIDNTATFGDVITANRVINLDSDITIGNITTQDTSHNYTISGPGILTLDRTTGMPLITVPSNSGRTLTISSVIAGTDGLEITGGGSNAGVVLNGANTFTGGIHLNSGTTGINQNFTTTAGLNGNQVTVSGTSYAAFAGGTEISGGVHINADANFRAGTNNNTLNITGALTGSGTLTHQQYGAGNQTITISDGSAFTGNLDYDMPRTARTVVNSLGDAGRIRFGLTNFLNNQDRQHIFEFGSGASADLVFDNRQFEILGSAPETTPRPNAAFEIRSNNADHALVVNTDLINSHTGTEANLRFSGSGNQANTFAGNIGDGPGDGTDPSVLNVFKLNGGTWNLDGDNSYTGTTTVTAGTLLINGNSSTATGDVTVASGATLGGSGTVGGATTINGALRPGTSPGVLSFSNSLALSATSTATFEIDGTSRGTQYDGVDIGSTVVYGGELVLDFGTLFGAGNYTFDLFDFAFGSDADEFSAVTLAGAYSGSLVYDTVDSWTLQDGDNTWTFTQSTGDLNFVVIPEPSSALLGCLGLLALLRRRR